MIYKYRNVSFVMLVSLKYFILYTKHFVIIIRGLSTATVNSYEKVKNYYAIHQKQGVIHLLSRIKIKMFEPSPF